MRIFWYKGRSRISMVWVPPLGFDPYCEGKWLPLQDKFTPSINSKKNFLQKLWTNFEKSRNLIFSKTAQPILITKIYVITFVTKIFSNWYLGWIYLVVGATYSRNMDQIRVEAPRPCLSCYGFFLWKIWSIKVKQKKFSTRNTRKNLFIKIVYND